MPFSKIFFRLYLSKVNTKKTSQSDQSPDRLLIYVGPFAKDLMLYIRLAAFFCALGFLMTPTMLMYGKAPVAGIIAPIAVTIPTLFINKISATYVSRLYIDLPAKIRYNPKMRRTFNPKLIDPPGGNPTIFMETYNWLGITREQRVKLNELKEYKGTNKWVTWVRAGDGGGGRQMRFYVEKEAMRRDPFTKGLVEFIEKKDGVSQIAKSTIKNKVLS
ncbi:10292_t:CDS:2 [Acaulospora morrowiae]|uniref:10292_t:CDS:1 n=1 Tax=Acaulospora morrowiae TaxID=94023 RepID=A0A9N9B8S0_9GLOM|nr:10292_t:CDS:2 [Acaulospora morrowiae]